MVLYDTLQIVRKSGEWFYQEENNKKYWWKLKNLCRHTLILLHYNYVHGICYTSPSLRYVIVYESVNLYIAAVVLKHSPTACVSFSFYLRIQSELRMPNYECAGLIEALFYRTYQCSLFHLLQIQSYMCSCRIHWC